MVNKGEILKAENALDSGLRTAIRNCDEIIGMITDHKGEIRFLGEIKKLKKILFFLGKRLERIWILSARLYRLTRLHDYDLLFHQTNAFQTRYFNRANPTAVTLFTTVDRGRFDVLHHDVVEIRELLHSELGLERKARKKLA